METGIKVGSALVHGGPDLHGDVEFDFRPTAGWNRRGRWVSNFQSLLCQVMPGSPGGWAGGNSDLESPIGSSVLP